MIHARFAEADQNGHFRIDHLSWGTYRLFGQKEEDGYPYTGASFWDNGTLSQCILTPESTTATTIVSIGPKAGIITGTILDATTGAPIPNAGIRLWPWSDKDRPMVGSFGNPYRVLIPPDQPVGI